MKNIYIVITCLMFYMCSEISLANPQQGNWRWRNDDGDIYSATWKDSANIPAVLTNYENVRIRIELFDNPDTSSISLWYTEDIFNGSWIKITNVDTGKFFISPTQYFPDTASYFDNQLLPETDTFNIYNLTITFDYSDNYFLFGPGLYELEYSLKPTMKIQPGSAYFFSLFNYDDLMYKNYNTLTHNGGDVEYPVLMTSPVNWFTQCSGTKTSLYDIIFWDENNGIAVGGDREPDT